jgi:hypothetical protein
MLRRWWKHPKPAASADNRRWFAAMSRCGAPGVVSQQRRDEKGYSSVRHSRHRRRARDHPKGSRVGIGDAWPHGCPQRTARSTSVEPAPLTSPGERKRPGPYDQEPPEGPGGSCGVLPWACGAKGEFGRPGKRLGVDGHPRQLSGWPLRDERCPKPLLAVLALRRLDALSTGADLPDAGTNRLSRCSPCRPPRSCASRTASSPVPRRLCAHRGP